MLGLGAAVWWLGAACATGIAARWGWKYYFYFRRARCDVAARYGVSKEAPGWAVVTGGSSGIGFEIVSLLLNAGFSVAVIALPQEERAFVRRLGAKGEHLGQRCFFVGVDASEGASAAVEARAELDERITHSDGGVRLLVHCVGGTSAKPLPLASMSEDDVQRLVNLNLVFGTALTAGILGGGMESTPGRKGIMFVGSQSGVLSASPLVAVYAAAKAGVASLAGSVASEFACRSVDIDVLCCTPGQTLSGSTLNWWGGDGWVPPYSFATPVQIAEGSLGVLDAGNPVVSPFWVHDIQQTIGAMLPSWVIGRLVYRELEPAMAGRRGSDVSTLGRRGSDKDE